MLNAVMLNVVMLIVAAPKQHAQNFSFLGKSFLLLESSNYVSSEPQQKSFASVVIFKTEDFQLLGEITLKKVAPTILPSRCHDFMPIDKPPNDNWSDK
jgi:hypothetical protein